MPLILPPGSLALANIRSQAARGEYIAQVLMSFMDNTRYLAMTVGLEGATAANVIRIVCQVTDQDGNKVSGVKDVLITSRPIAGAGTMTIGSAVGTAKAGSASLSLWAQTTAAGLLQVDVLNASVEDNLIMAQLDNGTNEIVKLTFA